MNRGQVAQRVAENKAKHPEKYCAAPRCLWALSSGPCPKHRHQRHAIRMAPVVVGTDGAFALPEVGE